MLLGPVHPVEGLVPLLTAFAEIAFDGIQSSSRYPGGMALRFARVKGYRPDKSPDEADPIEAVRAIFEGRA